MKETIDHSKKAGKSRLRVKEAVPALKECNPKLVRNQAGKHSHQLVLGNI